MTSKRIECFSELEQLSFEDIKIVVVTLNKFIVKLY